MTQTSGDTAVRQVWDEQSVWSQAANQAKARVDHARIWALALGVTAAALGTAASQTLPDRPALGRLAAFVAALAAGAAPLVIRNGGSASVNDWIRSRAVSEALKSEVYAYLSGVGAYRVTGPTQVLLERREHYRTDAADLIHHTHGITPRNRPLPAVSGPDSYVEQRVRRQLLTYYRPKAALMHRKVLLLSRVELGLGLAGAVLAAVSGVYEVESVAAWIAVTAFVSTAVAGHATAQRYAYQRLEFTRTSEELERLVRRWETAADNSAEYADAFVADCEGVISIQNEAWMIRWTHS